MDPASIVVGGCTLVIEIVKLGRLLKSIARSMKFAGHTINEIADEMSHFAELYQSCLGICSDSSAARRDPDLFPTLAAWLEKAMKGLRRILKKVKPLSSESTYDSSFIERMLAHATWYFNRDEVAYFRALLRVARESINGFTNVYMIEKLNKELKLLQDLLKNGNREEIEQQLGMTIEDRRREIHFLRRGYRLMRRKIEKRLDRARLDVAQEHVGSQHQYIAEPEPLLEFAAAVEDYVDNTMNPNRARRATSSMHSSTKTNDTQSSNVANPSSSTFTSATASSSSSSRLDNRQTIHRSNPHTWHRRAGTQFTENWDHYATHTPTSSVVETTGRSGTIQPTKHRRRLRHAGLSIPPSAEVEHTTHRSDSGEKNANLDVAQAFDIDTTLPHQQNQENDEIVNTGEDLEKAMEACDESDAEFEEELEEEEEEEEEEEDVGPRPFHNAAGFLFIFTDDPGERSD